MCLAIYVQIPQECHTLGRDAVFYLKQMLHVPGCNTIWKSITSDDLPSHLQYMLATPTPAPIITMCLPPDAEKQLCFLLNEVKFGHEHHFKQWLCARWLQGLSGEYTAVDMIRYLCSVYRRPSEASRTGIP